MLNAATLANLRRKSAYVDQVQLHDGVPLPSWIDLNLTERCNRSAGSAKPCVFCPRIDPAIYPDQKLHMSLDLARKIAGELLSLRYAGTVVLCGFGEPMLHPEFLDIVRELGEVCRVELVTNGDCLTEAKIRAMRDAGLDYIVVSMYDGPHQDERFRAMFAGAGCDAFLLRDRWHTQEDQFGLKLTNRAGTISVGPQDPVDQRRPCHYLAYQLTVDWNGDILLCVQDWHKRVKFGNLHAQSLLSIWTSPSLNKRRLQLIRGERCAAPCSGCNTDGTLHGFNHVPHWRPKGSHANDRHRSREIA